MLCINVGCINVVIETYRGLNVLLERADDILRHFAHAESVTSGFYEPQIVEETLKAKLILAENHWRKTDRPS